jgi:hypothetical protein
MPELQRHPKSVKPVNRYVESREIPVYHETASYDRNILCELSTMQTYYR